VFYFNWYNRLSWK